MTSDLIVCRNNLGQIVVMNRTYFYIRFIPEDMEFDQTPKDEVTEMPSTATYKPSLFANSALQQSTVSIVECILVCTLITVPIFMFSC